MILRNPNKGEKLDVAGLNEITVLIDRSETALTEVGFNKWRSGLEGPPHSHDQKEQIFYVTSGIGTIVLGPERFSVQPDQLIYVPTGLRHQALVGSDEPLVYLLFNAFTDSEKEGHASFADHIDKVKMDRKAQAEGTYLEDPETLRDAISRKGKWIPDVHSVSPIIDRNDTHRCEALLLELAPNANSESRTNSDMEQTLFVLSGAGDITIGDESAALGKHDVVFVPAGKAHTLSTGSDALTCLCLNTVF